MVNNTLLTSNSFREGTASKSANQADSNQTTQITLSPNQSIQVNIGKHGTLNHTSRGNQGTLYW